MALLPGRKSMLFSCADMIRTRLWTAECTYIWAISSARSQPLHASETSSHSVLLKPSTSHASAAWPGSMQPLSAPHQMTMSTPSLARSSPGVRAQRSAHESRIMVMGVACSSLQ